MKLAKIKVFMAAFAVVFGTMGANFANAQTANDVLSSLDELDQRMQALIQLNTARSNNIITYVQEAEDRIVLLEERIEQLEPVIQLGPFCPTETNPCGQCN